MSRIHPTSLRGGALAAIAASLLAVAPPLFADQKANVLIIFVDDLGYADLGSQGSKEARTPNIDSLASNGVRCTSGYVTAPMCSPSRAGLLTGRYQQRFGYEYNLGPVGTLKFGLPTDEKTIGDHLKAADYVTGALGKWDLGATTPYFPWRRGFDEFFGFLTGCRPFQPIKSDDATVQLRRNEKPVDETQYMTDALAEEASHFIKQHRDRPWLLYAAFNAPHWPMQAKAKHLKAFSDIKDSHRRAFLAMLASLDEAVGRILETLRETDQEQRTLIFFASDNGGPTGRPRANADAPFEHGINTSQNNPLAGEKGELREGGIRVPFLVQWKSRIPAGGVFDQPVSTLDILPTALAAAGQPPLNSKQVDGVDLLPYFTGQRTALPHEALYWRVGGTRAMRSGDWKLRQDHSGRFYLHNLSTDIGESRNLSLEDPNRLAEMKALLTAWDKELVEPLWAADGTTGRKAAK